jgi:predicted small secreted protein
MNASKFVRVLLAAAAVATTLTVAACNTTKGVGQDMQSAGGHIEHAAENNGANSR